MTDPKTMSDDEFLAAFLDCRIPPAGSNHEGHVRVAWLLLRRHPLDEAVEQACEGIRKLANHLGVPGKYHRTLSEALVRLMARDGAMQAELSWADFRRANRLLMTDARALLACHYSPEILESPQARTSFVAPDRRPLKP